MLTKAMNSTSGFDDLHRLPDAICRAGQALPRGRCPLRPSVHPNTDALMAPGPPARSARNGENDRLRQIGGALPNFIKREYERLKQGGRPLPSSLSVLQPQSSSPPPAMICVTPTCGWPTAAPGLNVALEVER